MDAEAVKATTWEYLRAQREAVLWKVEGLPERELRMPRTVTGTNLLGVVKHLAGVEAEYFGGCVGRPWPDAMPFWSDDAEANADMWATAEESPEEVLALYRSVITFADESIAALSLDAPAQVPWWQEEATTLHRLLVHMTAETARHAGHLDVLREQVDGHAGLLPEVPNLPEAGREWWEAYVDRLRAVADASGGRDA